MSARGFLAALRFLTAVPIPGRRGGAREDDVWAAAFFPLVGLLIGLPLALVLSAPLPPLPRAAVVLALWVGLTGGLHEDGWMDVLDGAFAPAERARRLEILRDPRVGAHGLTGGVVLLLLRFGALAAVPPAAVVTAPVLGRWAMAISLAAVPSARTSGLGAAFSRHPRPWAASAVAVAVLAPLAAWAGWGRVLAAVVLSGLLAAGWAAFLVGRFGGLSGDGHGAVGLLAETAALYAFLPVSGG